MTSNLRCNILRVMFRIESTAHSVFAFGYMLEAVARAYMEHNGKHMFYKQAYPMHNERVSPCPKRLRRMCTARLVSVHSRYGFLT